MDRPQLQRRRLLKFGAGLLGATALAACTPAPNQPGTVSGPPALNPSDGPAAGQPSGSFASGPRVDVTTGSFISGFRPDTPTGWSVAAPAPAGVTGRQKLPVAVFLHGTGSSNRFVFDVLGAQAVLQRHLDDGGPPFAIAAVDGGDTWWHPRADGTDTQAMLLTEFIPLLARQGFDAGKLGLFGLSMGGFGVLLLASQGKVAGLRGVAAMSPAVWGGYDAAVDGAFDSPADFAANDVFALRPQLRALPKRIDCGTGDALLTTVEAYVSGLPGAVEGGFEPGGHEESYWRRVLPDVVSFLGRNLA